MEKISKQVSLPSGETRAMIFFFQYSKSNNGNTP
jgi:hypothetical protein